jgi:ribosomal protein S18 acetylase RimI-like enzyme
MTDVTIRPYRPADLESCRALWVELVQRHRHLYDDPSIGGEAPGLHFDRHLARVGPERIWVAKIEGKVLGMVALILDGDEAEIDPIVVASTHRGQGIGRALLNRAVEEAKACSAYPAAGPDVTSAGGEYVDIPVDKAHVDGNLVTAPAWPAHPDWLAKFLEVLGTKIEP